MKGRDTAALINGFSQAAAAAPGIDSIGDIVTGDVRGGSVNRGRVPDWKRGNSKGFASVRSRRWDGDGGPSLTPAA